MECKKCSGFSEIKDIFNSSCVGEALEVIKKHFVLFKKIAENRGKEIELLMERNERLLKTVDFLERDKKDANKRRKKNLQGDYIPQKNNFVPTFASDSRENSVCSDMTSSPGRSTDLNLALNMDTSSSVSLTQDETIAETEKVNSPRKHSFRNTKSRLFQQQNAYNNCENPKTNARPTSPNSSCWMGKEQIFVEPKRNSNILSEKKSNLSFHRKPDRMKQTKLVFDVKKTNQTNYKDCPEREVIAESPNLYSSLKQAKHSRSLMLRTGNSNVSRGNSSKAKNLHKSFKDIITFNDYDDDDNDENSDHFFDFNETKHPAPKFVSFKSSGSPAVKEKEQMSYPSQNYDTSSVVMLSPATQDIIFVDDSHIGTMDLLDDNQDQLLRNLKRFESKSIDKQKATNQIRKTKTDAFAMKSNAPAIVKKERITQDLNRDNETTMLPEEYFMETDANPQQNEDSFDDEFVQPIIVKRESDIPTNKSNLKQRFNVTCDECIKYLELFGTNLTDRQIENHLRDCKHQNDQERLGHITPPGFWNPLIESFAEDDPRRKVFIDTRFVDKKKNK